MEWFVTILIILLIGGLGFTYWQLWQLQQKYGQFLKGAEAKQIEEMVKNYSKAVTDAHQKLEELAVFCAKLHKNQKFAISNFGLIRFNPFGDTGGDQSFALALLDRNHDGVVLTGVHSRNTTRVYAKQIHQGTSKSNLSGEEKQALTTALQK
ncbi:DUF4446 family protein [Candidatus Saccharibacteria bacterium]|nr:DUF4446 family protein [Candidatus Saccharibacteria bacterium]